MAKSIAKTSIQIAADATELSRGLNTAGAEVKDFAGKTSSLIGGSVKDVKQRLAELYEAAGRGVTLDISDVRAKIAELGKLKKDELAKVAKAADVTVTGGASKADIVGEIERGVLNRYSSQSRTSYGKELPPATMEVEVKPKNIEATKAEIEKKLSQDSVKAKVDFGESVEKEIKALRQSLAKVNAVTLKPDVDPIQAQAKIDAIKAKVEELRAAGKLKLVPDVRVNDAIVKLKDLQGQVQKIRTPDMSKVGEIGEKLTSSIGRVEQLGSAFEQVQNGTAGVVGGVNAIEQAVGGVAIGLKAATSLTTGFKAALIGTGIGALIIGLGWLMSKFRTAKAEADKAREEEERRERSPGEAFLEARGIRPAPPPPAPAPAADPLLFLVPGGERAADRAAAAMGRRRAAMLAATVLEHRAVADRIEALGPVAIPLVARGEVGRLGDMGAMATSVARRFADMARSAGGTREALDLMAVEAESAMIERSARVTMVLEPMTPAEAAAAIERGLPARMRRVELDMGLHFPTDEARRAFEEMSRAIGTARRAMMFAEDAARMPALSTMAERFRDTIATAGMSADELDIYRASLTRTTEIIDGFAVTTTRAMTPTERLAERTRVLTEDHRRGRLTADELAAALDRVRAGAEAEAAALARTRREATLADFSRRRTALGERTEAERRTVTATSRRMRSDEAEVFLSPAGGDATERYNRGMAELRRQLEAGTITAARYHEERLRLRDAALAEGRAVAALRVEHDRLGHATRVSGLGDMSERMRDEADTVGMAAEEVEIYRASMSRVMGSDGIMRSISETPLERYNRRIEELRETLTRAGHAEGDIEDVLSGMADLTRLPAELADAGHRAAEFASEMDETEEAIRRVRAEASRGIEARRIFAGMERGRELIRSLTTPVDALKDRMKELEDLWWMGSIGDEDYDRLAGRELMAFAGRGGSTEAGAVGAAQFGSAEAYSAIQAARRAATATAEDPVERVRRAIEAGMEIARREADATERVARAIEGGAFAAVGF